jgi:hypothetical protein
MSKYNLTQLLNEYVGGGRIGTYPTTAMQLVQDMDDLKRNNSNIEVRRTDGSGDGKVSITYTVVEKGQDPSKQERGFTVYDYKIGDWVDERGEYEGAMDYAEQEFDFSIGGNDLALATELLDGVKSFSLNEEKEVEYYPETFIELATNYIKQRYDGKRLGKMTTNQLEILGKKLVDTKYDGDVSKALQDMKDKIIREKDNTEDNVDNIDTVASPSAKGKGYS